MIDKSNTYEQVGAGLYNSYKYIVSSDAQLEEKQSCGLFLKQYRDSPLFIIGVSNDDLKNHIEGVIKEVVGSFKLPFDSILFELPVNTVLKGRSSIVSISKASEDMFYIEFLEKISNNLTFPILSFILVLNRLNNTYQTSVNKIIHTNECDSKYIYKSNTMKEISKTVDFWSCKGCLLPTHERACDENENLCTYYSNIIIGAIDYINRPQNYIIKEVFALTSKEKRLISKNKRPYFGKKDRHVVLDYTQVKELIKQSQGGHHASPLPHERRGHWRNLRADRFKEKKIVWVRPADVNAGLTWEDTGRKRTYLVVR